MPTASPWQNTEATCVPEKTATLLSPTLTTSPRAPTLIIGLGNPDRGDDALGPRCLDYLTTLALPGVELLSDFQLQVEFALDLAERDAVIFVDAAASGAAPFAYTPVMPDTYLAHTSHALTPAQLLAACARIGVSAPQSVWLLAIRGYDFELGVAPGTEAVRNLEAAQHFLAKHVLTSLPSPVPGGQISRPAP